MNALVDVFSWLMDFCHQLVPNYWWDIVLFTAVTKVLQFPVSLWCHVNGLKMVSLMPRTNRIRIEHYGDGEAIGDETAKLFREERYHPLLSLVPLAIQIVILMCFIKVIYSIAAAEKGSVIGAVPVTDGGIAWIMPVLAGAAAWLLGFFQNRINPLQHEQTRTQQIVTNGISIAISLFLGMFVAMGVGLYWAASNVLSILVQLACNAAVRPQTRVDYRALRRSQAELARFERSLLRSKTVSQEDRRREKADYRRFFRVANKHLVIYAESGGFYKYFRGIVEWLLAHSNLTVHYVTNDPKDGIFSHPAAGGEKPRIRAYYIGPVKIIPLMMKMDADMVLMTTPDLNTYQIKRSYVRKDVEYVYVDHGTSSISMVFRKGAFDHFDTFFLNGKFQIAEHRKTEEIYGLKAKRLVPTGYPYLGDLIAGFRADETPHAGVRILLAPSHQPGNIFELCLEPLLEALAQVPDAHVTLRPHPQFVRRFPAKMQAIADRWGKEPWLTVDADFSWPPALYESDIVITDWSSIAYEFSLVTKRPSIQVNTPMKVVNPEYRRIGLEPTDITFRSRIGVSVNPDRLDELPAVVAGMRADPGKYKTEIERLLAEEFYDPLKAAETAGEYILKSLMERKGK